MNPAPSRSGAPAPQEAGAHRHQLVLTTARLALRRLDAGDAVFVLALLNDPAWIANIGDRGVRDEAAARAWIANGPGASFESIGFGLMACDRRVDGTTVGICGLIRRPGLDDVDLGYALLPAHRGRGYVTEAARATLAWGRDVHGLRRVVAIVASGNAASLAVLARCSFAFEREIVMPGDTAPVELHAVDLATPRHRAGTQDGPSPGQGLQSTTDTPSPSASVHAVPSVRRA